MFSVKEIVCYWLILTTTCWALDETVGCGGKPLYSKYGITQERVNSPDGKKILTFERKDPENEDTYVLYGLQVGREHFRARLDGWGPEVLWSPDSKIFAVNQTEGEEDLVKVPIFSM